MLCCIGISKNLAWHTAISWLTSLSVYNFCVPKDLVLVCSAHTERLCSGLLHLTGRMSARRQYM